MEWQYVVVATVGIGAISVIESIALLSGNNGTTLSATVAVIGAICGAAVGSAVTKAQASSESEGNTKP